MGIETRIKRVESPTFGIFYKIYITDNVEFMFALDEQEFDNLITQIEKAKNE